MRQYQTTHRVTIQRYEETGEVVDDGMGGTQPRLAWVDYGRDIPVRYLPQGVGLERERHGDVYRESPSMLMPARSAGELLDGEYVLTLGTGDDWRVGIEGITGTNSRRSITDRRPLFGKPTRTIPTAVHVELETLRD